MFPGTSDILIMIAAVSAMFVALFAGTAPTEAATFSIIAQGHSMTLDGPIEIGDAARLDQAYRQSCDRRGFCPERLFLDSHGGRVGRVPPHRRCRRPLCHAHRGLQDRRDASRPASTSSPPARCGWFSPARPSASIPSPTSNGAENGDTLEWTREMVGILRDRLGVPPGIIAKLLATPPSGMTYLTADDVNGWVQWLD